MRQRMVANCLHLLLLSLCFSFSLLSDFFCVFPSLYLVTQFFNEILLSTRSTGWNSHLQVSMRLLFHSVLCLSFSVIFPRFTLPRNADKVKGMKRFTTQKASRFLNHFDVHLCHPFRFSFLSMNADNWRGMKIFAVFSSTQHRIIFALVSSSWKHFYVFLFVILIFIFSLRTPNETEGRKRFTTQKAVMCFFSEPFYAQFLSAFHISILEVMPITSKGKTLGVFFSSHFYAHIFSYLYTFLIFLGTTTKSSEGKLLQQ